MPKDDSLKHAISEEVHIAAHDSQWAAQFVAERDRLLGVLPGHFAAIEHIGSTAVPRLAANGTCHSSSARSFSGAVASARHIDKLGAKL
jgi:hypothetical protein